MGSFPVSDSYLVVATPEENFAQLNVNSSEWRGSLSLEAYLRREDHLANQALTKNGGLTAWMLVRDTESGQREVLCGCESIKKRGLLAKNGKVEDVVLHGVASVFCPPENRGKGYAGRMMAEVGRRLDTWQVEAGTTAPFTVLYSDIGKKFYAANGWHPFPSAHISLPAAASTDRADLPTVRKLVSEDLSELCAVDEKLIRSRLSKPRNPEKTAVVVLPDHEVLQWHRAREEFVSNELYHQSPTDIGAMVGETDGTRVFCYWTRVWSNPEGHEPNTLHILRLVVEDESFSDFDPASEAGVEKLQGSAVVQSTAALLAAAQQMGSQWDMKEVQIWNPTSATLAAARMLDPASTVAHREKESIASLRWNREGSWKDVDWMCNEKYGWN